MKRLLQSLAILLLAPAALIAQNSLTINGLVQTNGDPISNSMVLIISPSTPALPGDTLDILFTDENGIFLSEMDLEIDYPYVSILAELCPNIYLLDSLLYPSTHSITLNCDSLPPDFYCNSYFYMVTDSLEDGSIYYINASQGTDLNYIWNFGDGTQSFEAYPTHTYADSDAEYEVCLTITGEDCQDQYCTTVSGSYDGTGDGPGFTGSGFQSQQGEGTGFTFVVLENSTTGIIENLKEVVFNIYPNPSHGTVNFKLETDESGTVTLVDLSGKIVLEQNNANANGSRLDLSNLKDGIYIVQFKSEKSIATRKLVLQR